MSTELKLEGRAFLPVELLVHGEDYAATLAEAGFAPFTPLLLAACDAERERLATPRDRRQDRVVAEARAAADKALTPTQWENTYTRGNRMTVMEALDEALGSTAGLRI